MNTFAYCSASFAPRMARLAGVPPATCQPTIAETFDLSLLQDRDLVWFKLHGRRGERTWYGDNWTTALSADRLATADLAGAVVFALLLTPNRPVLWTWRRLIDKTAPIWGGSRHLGELRRVAPPTKGDPHASPNPSRRS